ncbi:MAG: hypothetical protein MZU97_00435 [Bacillus subtilis]|nr:hypothetical protein [Bacillus subtilis]
MRSPRRSEQRRLDRRRCTMMTELYTIYSLDNDGFLFLQRFPARQVARSAWAISGCTSALLNAAPDIQGLWAIAPMPGVEQGRRSRRPLARPARRPPTSSSPKPTKPTESLGVSCSGGASTETQIDVSKLLLLSTPRQVSTCGTARTVAAFARGGLQRSPTWTSSSNSGPGSSELPKVPGSYQVELEISNVWNSVVLEPRQPARRD